MTEAGSMPPSISESLPKTLMFTEPPSTTLAVSLVATGASLTGVIVIDTVASLETTPLVPLTV